MCDFAMNYLSLVKNDLKIKEIHKVRRETFLINTDDKFFKREYITSWMCLFVLGKRFNVDIKNKRLYKKFCEAMVFGQCLASFDVGKHVLEFDADLENSLDCSIEDIKRMDMGILRKLPFYGAFVKIRNDINGYYGFYVSHDFLKDFNEGLNIIMISKNYDDYLLLRVEFDKKYEISFEKFKQSELKAISLLLYICSENADIERDAIKNPQIIKTRRGERLFFSDKPHYHCIGMTYGEKLRKARESNFPEERSAPRAHLRRAHWHTYRIGKGRVATKLRWLHPMLIGYKDLPDEAFT